MEKFQMRNALRICVANHQELGKFQFERGLRAIKFEGGAVRVGIAFRLLDRPPMGSAGA
jgi:hypothetical protein